jgi:CO dehydrogenase/acetyl-CoA synthase alpha subunit
MALGLQKALCTYGWSKLFVNGRYFLDVNFTRSEGRPVVSAIGTGSNALTAVASWQHWTGDQW